MEARIGRGPGHWLSSYLAMLRFDIASQRTWLPMFVLTQVMFGAGMAIIYGFYLGHMSHQTALFIVSGSPAAAVLTSGLIGVTTMVVERKETGSWDFVWSLPAPRSAVVASTFTVFTLMAIPGIVIALALAAWRYGLTLTPSPMAVPAVLLTALMATSVGFGMAQLIPNPLVTGVVVNALIFVVLMYSPVSFPITQFPHWLAGVQRVLPMYYSAQVLRASVTTGIVHDLALSYTVLAAWTAAAWAGAAWVVGRRRLRGGADRAEFADAAGCGEAEHPDRRPVRGDALLKGAEPAPVGVDELRPAGTAQRDDGGAIRVGAREQLGDDVADTGDHLRVGPVRDAVDRHHDLVLQPVGVQEEQPQRAQRPGLLVDDGGDPGQHVRVASDRCRQQFSGVGSVHTRQSATTC
jgi:ABC-2 type transport system permease protein